MEPITRRAALGAALAVPAAAALAGAARAASPTEIELFFPVPVQGMLANKMRELVDRFNAAHADIKATAVYTGSYDDTNLKTRAAIKAGKPPAAVIMSANFVREYVINDDVDAFDPLIEEIRQDAGCFHGRVLAGAEAECSHRAARLRHPVPELDAAVVLQCRGLHRGRPRSRPSARHLGRLDRCGKEAGQNRRRTDAALGPDVPRHLRLLRLDRQRADDVEWRPVLQSRLRRRGLLQRPEHARRADPARRDW